MPIASADGKSIDALSGKIADARDESETLSRKIEDGVITRVWRGKTQDEAELRQQLRME